MVELVEDFKKRVKDLENELDKVGNNGQTSNISEHGFQRIDYKKINFQVDLKALLNDAWKLVEYGDDEKNRANVLAVLGQFERLKNSQKKEEAKKMLAEIGKSLGYLKPVRTVEKDISFIQMPKLPEVIAEEIAADLNELRKCFIAGAYRSCVVLCGRIMETALHRKYFEVAGQDLMETAPGIGLGNLIAKLKEKNVKIDPGLTQQIHLINQVRVFSVHSKKEAFYPSKEQAQATILFTLDVLKKLFE